MITIGRGGRTAPTMAEVRSAKQGPVIYQLDNDW